MQGDRFYLEIQGNKVQINEPWDFSNVDFTIIQDKEYFYRDLAFGGNKAELLFKKSRHDNVLDSLFKEANTNGSNAEVYFYYNDDIRLRLDFGTYETNDYDYFSCQGIKDTILDILNDNKDVKIDLLSDKDIFENNAPKLDLRRAYASAMGIDRESNWKNDKDTSYGELTKQTMSLINNIGKINRSDIKNTYVPYMGEVREPWDRWDERRKFLFTEFIDNYKNVNVQIKLNQTIHTSMESLNPEPILWLVVGEMSRTGKDWYDNSRWIEVAKTFTNATNTIVKDFNIYLGTISRGMGIWLFWQADLRSNPDQVWKRMRVIDHQSEVIIKGQSFSYGSIIYSNTYEKCINNLLSKIVPNTTCEFKDNTLQGYNLLFSGNQIRFGEEKPFILTWKDVTEQLKEFGLGYRLEGNTVVFDKIESFYKNELVHHFSNVRNYDDFKISEDDTYNVNVFEYKYKKYQALKENAIEGNAGTINGESQWYIKNKYTDNSLKIDLPISRDKFLLEDTRVQALAYNENTSTNEDSTLYLFNAKTGNIVVEDTAFLRASFDTAENTQSFSVRESEFSWVKIGVQENTLINFKINNVNREYIVRTVSDNTIICTRLNHTQVLNLDTQFVFFFSANSDYNFNVSNANDSKSIRQNIEEMRRYLSTYNYYTNSPITNREYKENADFTYNGIKETDPIQSFQQFKLTPKIVEFKTVDRFEVYKLIENNINGYCTVNNLKGELIRFYIKELNLRVLECGNAEYEIKGQIYDTVL